MSHGSEHIHRKVVPTNVLYLSQIPQKGSSIPGLIKHFQRYGTITSIYSNFSCASITYDSNESCKKALESPEAYCNNRLIKYSYHFHPDTAESNLSRLVDIESIEEDVNVVKSRMEEATRETMKIQDDIFNQNQNEEATRETMKIQDDIFNQNQNEETTNNYQDETNTDSKKEFYMEVKDDIDKTEQEISDLKNQFRDAPFSEHSTIENNIKIEEERLKNLKEILNQFLQKE